MGAGNGVKRVSSHRCYTVLWQIESQDSNMVLTLIALLPAVTHCNRGVAFTAMLPL